jgi:N-glycosylase/DNA lyase
MMQVQPLAVERAVAAIYPDIANRVASAEVVSTEERLWWELSCCILSSQVPYDLAAAAADAVQSSGLLLGPVPCDVALCAGITDVLQSKLKVNGRERRYRFPAAKGRQLAASKLAVLRKATSLTDLLCEMADPVDIRLWLVGYAPGIGPKQASMFLRNIGVTYDLAVLDRHVVDYMALVGINRGAVAKTGTLAGYGESEERLRAYAKAQGFSVGLLDWAIWIVMRSAKELSDQEVMQ